MLVPAAMRGVHADELYMSAQQPACDDNMDGESDDGVSKRCDLQLFGR